jgi:uncharacterized protein (DUF362 family)
MSMRRRELLAAGLATMPLMAGCEARPPARRAPPTSPAPAPAPQHGAARAAAGLALVASRDHLATLARAIELAGGLGAVGSGATVLVKVNTNSGDPYPYSSSPVAVEWLAGELRARGARVIVGDRSFWGDHDTLGNLERNGIAAAARAAGAELVAFETDATEWEELPPEAVPTWVPPVRVPRLAVAAELVVNLACLKTHFITGATLTMKNLLGLVHPDDRRREGNLRTHHRDRIHRQVREIQAALRPGLNLIDAHRALVSGGPTPGSGAEPTFAEPAAVIASSSRVGCDVFGLALLRRHAPASEEVTGAPPWQSPILRAAASDAPASLAVVIEGVAEADTLFTSVAEGAPMPITRA